MTRNLLPKTCHRLFLINAHRRQHTYINHVSIRTCTHLAQIVGAKSEYKIMEVSRKRKRHVTSHVVSHVETTLSGRREEMDSIRSFLSKHVKKQRPGSLFVTGPPGTGKTATIKTIFTNDTVRKCRAILTRDFCVCMKNLSIFHMMVLCFV